MKPDRVETPWFWDELEVRLRKQAEQQAGRPHHRASTWLPSLSQVGVGIGVAASLLAFSMVALINPVRYVDSVVTERLGEEIERKEPLVVPFDDTTAASHRTGPLRPQAAPPSFLDRAVSPPLDGSTLSVDLGEHYVVETQLLGRSAGSTVVVAAEVCCDPADRQ